MSRHEDDGAGRDGLAGGPREDWERAAAIKKGKGEWPGYDTLRAWIQQTPKTMLPGLLTQCVVSCLAGEVFQEDGLQKTVDRIEAQWKSPGHGVLRED